MNFKIKSKLAETWNPVLLTIYEALPYPFNEIIWKLEQLRTPKVFYYDLENGVKLVKVR